MTDVMGMSWKRISTPSGWALVAVASAGWLLVVLSEELAESTSAVSLLSAEAVDILLKADVIGEGLLLTPVAPTVAGRELLVVAGAAMTPGKVEAGVALLTVVMTTVLEGGLLAAVGLLLGAG